MMSKRANPLTWFNHATKLYPHLNRSLIRRCLAKLCNLSMVELLQQWNSQAYELNVNAYEKLLALFNDGYPFAYYTNTIQFGSKQFYVDERVLIPRIETWQLVVIAEQWMNRSCTNSFTFADIGTGSGVIGCSLASSQSSHDWLLNRSFLSRARSGSFKLSST